MMHTRVPRHYQLVARLVQSRLVCQPRRIRTPSTNPYKNHRFLAEVISHGVWLYFRFCLSYRDVEKLLFTRGVSVTYIPARGRV
jgi:putative transposase